MATTVFAPETERVWTTRLDPGAWKAYRTLRLMALRTDPQAFEASYEEQRARPDAWWREHLRDAASGSGSWLLFAQQEQRLVGMAGARVTEDRLTADVTGVFVVRAARGNGIASTLINAILHDLTQDHAIGNARLHVNASQMAAVRLYERYGFRIVKTERLRCGDGNTHDVHLMEKLLR
jgi:ribosomal protein S18 acetylase RimI-like enzyme